MPAVHSEDPFVTYGGYTIKTARLSAKTTTRRISMTMKKLRWSLRCIDALTPLFFPQPFTEQGIFMASKSAGAPQTMVHAMTA